MRGVPSDFGAHDRVRSVTSVPHALIVEADGGSRGNPGPAGYGALVRDADTGEVLRELAGGIGVASNNVAEYRGLIAGLAAAAEMDPASVEVRMDSKLVVEQMSGRWQVKHPDMKQLAAQAAELVRRLPSVRFMHVRRELNREADRLANQAMDAQAAGREWTPSDSSPPVVEERREANRLVGWGAPAGPSTSMLLARHGETPLSIERRFNGRNQTPLTDLGRAQAAAIGQRLKEKTLAAVVTSPLPRTRETAEAVAAATGAPVIEESGLMETDFGEWDGLTFGEVRERWPRLLEEWLADPAASPPGGESLESVGRRVLVARDRLVVDWPASTIAVICHVTPIKWLLREALGAPAAAIYRTHVDPASLSQIDWHADHHPVVRLVNDTSHLGHLATTFQV